MSHDSIAAATRGPFVGRDFQLAQLLHTLTTPAHTGATNHLITGPAGVGKSRLALEFAKHARARGHRVVTARAWTGSAPFWPWTQILRGLLGEPRAVELAPLVLEDPDTASSFELFDAVVTTLRTYRGSEPLVLIFEDLHELDPSSLTLLNYVTCAFESEQHTDGPLLIVATARTADAELSRCFGARIELIPFDLTQTTRLLALEHSGISERRVALIHAAAGGLPLLLDNLRHSWTAAAQGELAHEPLAAILKQRLTQLPTDVRGTLAALAVLGQGDTSDLSRVAELSPDRVLAALAQAAELQMINDTVPITFAHTIIRDAVAAQLPPPQATALHERAARLFAASTTQVARHARHLTQAGPAHAPAAARACLLAARRALNQLAFADSAALCQLALDCLDRASEEVTPETLAGLYLTQTLALLRCGERGPAVAAWTAAWIPALASGRPELIVAAARGPRTGFDFSGRLPYDIAARATHALDTVPDLSAAEQSLLHSALTGAQLSVAPTAAVTTAARALELAQRAKSTEALAHALLAQATADLSPDTMYSRLATAPRIVAMAQSLGDRDLVATARFLLLGTMVEAGDLAGLDRELAENAPLVAQFTGLHDNRHSSWFRTLRALLDGDTAAAAALLDQALTRAQAENDPDALSVWGAQASLARWMSGDLAGIEPILRQATQLFPTDLIWTAALAWLWSKMGRHTAASGLLTQVTDLSQIPRDRNWLAAIAIIAEVAADLGDGPLMEQAAAALAPYSNRLVSIGLGIATWGTVARPLALIAQAHGDQDRARAYYEQGLDLCARTGAQAWLAQIQIELATLLAQGTAADRARAATLAAEAHAAATHMSWPGLTAQADQVRSSLGPLTVLAETQAPPTTSQPKPVIHVLGRFEVINDQGTVRWTSRRARTLLKILVARRGTPIARSDLLSILWPTTSHDLLANRFAVALTTVRRALDPARATDLQHYVQFDGEYASLNISELESDVEQFLELTSVGLGAHDHDALAAATKLYVGEAFNDEFAALWAEPLREEAQTSFSDCAHVLATMSEPARAADLFRAILSFDEFDLAAHDGLTDSLHALGAPRQAQVAQNRAELILKELDD